MKLHIARVLGSGTAATDEFEELAKLVTLATRKPRPVTVAIGLP